MHNDTLYKHLAEHFNLPLSQLQQTGTHILPDESCSVADSQVIWTLDDVVIIQTHPSYVTQFEEIIQNDEVLSIAEIAEILPVEVLEQNNFNTVTSAEFKPARCDYAIRALTPSDKVAFEVFLANCSARDKEYGEVGLDHEAIFGAVDGDRIIGSASSYEWHGFVDFGVLTDPNYRGQRIGKAVSSAITEYYLKQADNRPLLWRHETSNLGSGKIAQHLGWKRFATLDYIQFQEKNS